jgi:2-polyprenyl-3-methyl-5-hydroxy-6-metoxy-1,4-benzoquinol methylase
MTTTPVPAIDQAKVEHFTHQIIGDLGAAMSAVLIRIGDRLGLYRALGDSQPASSADLAAKTGLAERYVREWLHNQAAAGWVTYDPGDTTFTLPAEHALLLADEHSPAFLLGGFDIAAAVWADEDILADAFRTGAGIGWHQHDSKLFAGTERFFRPGYQANLISSWLPAVDGMVQRLQQGIAVADVGCGFGASTVLLGQQYPNSTFAGFDYHDASIAAARRRAAQAGVAGNVTFEVAGAKDFPGQYDLICLFDCLHDMGDPLGAARRVRQALRPDGVLLLVEPNGADHPEDNHHPLGRLFYACSTALCTPSSLAQEGQLGLGNQAGTARLTEILTAAGFSSVRVATSTPINVIVDARP